MEYKTDCKPLTYGDRVYSFELNFLRMSLDEQFEFLEYFKSVLAMKGNFEKFLFEQMVNRLEKEMFENLDSWLESELEK